MILFNMQTLPFVADPSSMLMATCFGSRVQCPPRKALSRPMATFRSGMVLTLGKSVQLLAFMATLWSTLAVGRPSVSPRPVLPSSGSTTRIASRPWPGRNSRPCRQMCRTLACVLLEASLVTPIEAPVFGSLTALLGSISRPLPSRSVVAKPRLTRLLDRMWQVLELSASTRKTMLSILRGCKARLMWGTLAVRVPVGDVARTPIGTPRALEPSE